MPTTKPRLTITETDEVTTALDEAAQHWPEESGGRGRLLLRLIEEGRRAIREEHRRQVARRRDALQRTRGALTGTYPRDYLTRLRDEWPA